MRYARLIAVDDEFDTAPGLVLKGTQMTEGMMGDRDGTLLAHDLLEHQNGVGAIGRIADELEALGGIWQVRGRHGDMLMDRRSIWSPAQNIAHDIAHMFEEIPGDLSYWPSGKLQTHRHLYDEDFEEIIRYAREYIERDHDFSERPEDKGLLEDYLSDALHLMRTGFRKAERRFGTGYEGCALFVAVRDAVRRAHPEFVGQEFILAYGRGEATIREVYPDGY